MHYKHREERVMIQRDEQEMKNGIQSGKKASKDIWGKIIQNTGIICVKDTNGKEVLW